MQRVEVDFTERDPGLSEPLRRAFPSRRASRRARRHAQEIDERLKRACEGRDLTVAIWRETTRDATFGFATGVRWHAIAFGEEGDLVASVRDVMPLAASELKPRLLEQIDALP
jgi:hypothetical protein